MNKQKVVAELAVRIALMRAQGRSNQDVKHRLIQIGWAAGAVREAMAAVHANVRPPQSNLYELA